MTPGAAGRRERPRDLLLFRSPGLWPHWPFLPVVRATPEGGRQCGVLYDAVRASCRYGYSATVFLANLFALPTTEEDLFARPRFVYDAPEELADGG